MSLLFADGFDWLPTGSVTTDISGTKYNTVSGNPTRVQSRTSSGFAIRITSGELVTRFPLQSRVYVGAAIQPYTSNAKIFTFKDGSGNEQGYIGINTSNHIVIGRSATVVTLSNVLSNSTWNHLEACIDFNSSTTANDWFVRLNGIMVASGTDDLSAQSSANCGGVGLQSQIFDDFYVTNDSGGATDNFRGFLGPISIRTLFPIGSGIQLNHKNEKNIVSPLNYASVSGSYDGDVSYIEGSGNATTDLYTMQDLSDNYSFINGLRVTSHARFVDSAFGYYNHMLSNSTQSDTNFPGSGNMGTSYWATSHTLSKSFITSNNWNVTEVNDLQVGTRMAVD